jgi:ubiquinone/menaquinone biosynthesis C-methylase UbiE
MYFDIKRKRVIQIDKDSVLLDTWMKGGSDDYSCSKHPDGFLIFLEPHELESFNEYKEGDPYGVSKNINSKFQNRRFQTTIQLLKSTEPNPNIKILDLGCGEGHLTDRIRDTFPSSEIHGLDYAIDAIKIAHSSYKNINFIVADGYKPPYSDEYFDIVVLNNIWEHVPDPLQMLNGIKRILKKDGIIVISTPSRYRFSNLIRVLLGKKVEFMSKLHVTEYSVGQVVEQLTYCGFSISRVHSESIRENRLIVHLVKKCFSVFAKLVNSHHIFESTVFYLASKK